MTIANKIIFSSTLVALLAALAGFMGWKNSRSIKGGYSDKVAQFNENAQMLEAIKTAALPIRWNSSIQPISPAVEKLEENIALYVQNAAPSPSIIENLEAYPNRYAALLYPAMVVEKGTMEELMKLEKALMGTVDQAWQAEFAACQEVGAVEVKALKSLMIWVVAISGIAFILALLFGQLIARDLSKTLRQLRNAARDLQSGDYSSRVALQAKNEFGKLGMTFNELAENLEHSKIIEQQNFQLEELNLRLKKKNDSLDSFVYRVSHDLKAPVVNLQALLEVVRYQVKDSRNEVLHQSLFFMGQSSDKLQQTIQDLLEVSRIERKLQEDKESLSLEAVMAEIREENDEIINNSSATIHCDFEEAPEIFFSKTNLKSILTNLLTNSIKYAAENRPPEIHLQTTRTAKYVCLSIRDNGIGIDLDKHRDKLFGMFNRFHNHVEGSGVGLYIVKKLLDENGGQLEIESQVGAGTTIRAYFMPQEKFVIEPVT